MESYAPIVIAIISACVSVGVAIYSYLTSWKNNKISISLKAIENWNSYPIIQSRNYLYKTLLKQEAWSEVRKDTAVHDQVYTALAAIDTLGMLVKRDVFDKKDLAICSDCRQFFWLGLQEMYGLI